MALQKTSVEMKSSLQNPKTTLRRKLHQIIVQLISDIVLAVVDDFQLCIRCCGSAPDIGWSVAAHVDVHADEVVRLEEALSNKWQQLEIMLICSKISFCATHYNKSFQMGNVSARASLIQSLNTLYKIRDIKIKLRKLKPKNTKLE